MMRSGNYSCRQDFDSYSIEHNHFNYDIERFVSNTQIPEDQWDLLCYGTSKKACAEKTKEIEDELFRRFR
jgi:hypothetical protein